MKQMRADLKASETVDTFFALSSVELRRSSRKKPYLALTLTDRDGQINGYLWNYPEMAAEDLRDAIYVRVQGLAKMHNGTLIISVEHIRSAREEEVNIHDFLDVVPGGVDLWMGRLHDHIELIRDRNCRALIDSFMSDLRFYEEFRIAPAALSIHHNYVGGLLEHSVNTMSHAVHVSEYYPALLDRDLLLTGALTHDIGKVREISGSIKRSYSMDGKLLGHISIGLLMLEEKLQLLKDFPSDLGPLLRHMILAHHGSLECGSPIRPATPEAIALHLIENMDAKMNHLYGVLNNSDPQSSWSVYDRQMSTEIYQKKFDKDIIISVEKRSNEQGQCVFFQ